MGGNPFQTTSIYSLICYLERKWGVWFPMGGTGQLVRGLVNLIEGQGNEVRLFAEVDEDFYNEYKFYLAFENNNCQDYVTEKFFKILHLRNTIPIVRGAKKE